MADKGGSAATKTAQATQAAASNENRGKIKVISFSLNKATVDRIGRVKRWEERSQATSLELTGRR